MAKCLTQRADIALLSEQRMTNWKISDKVDLPVNQVGKWRRRFLGQVESLNAVAQEKPADLEKGLVTRSQMELAAEHILQFIINLDNA